jgi:nifR3 family TIM-barrel protein
MLELPHMNFGFWKQLSTPIFVLAPMADVTDAAFRQVIAKYGKPDVMWTEFVSADGLCSPGATNLLPDLWYDESQRPIIGQIFGGKPDNIKGAAKLLVSLGFDGVDINMGCPSKDIEKSCSGAALIKDPELAIKIIQAAKDGAGDLPVSVKTRIGYRSDETETWIRAIIQAQPAAVIIHARTRNEMSKVPARWETVARAVEIAKELFPNPADRPLILGNGDVQNLTEAEERVKETGCDGVMIGRGIFGNPWLFNRKVDAQTIPLTEKLTVMLEHTKLFDELLGKIKPLEMMKKHYKAYVNGFAGAAELRAKLMEAESYNELEETVTTFLKSQ